MGAIELASRQRNLVIPEVPTLREQSTVVADAESWTVFSAPARTLAPALNRELLAALGKPVVRDALSQIGFTVELRSPAEFSRYHTAKIETWSRIIDQVKVKQDG